MRLAKNAENEDTWLRSAELEMHRRRGTAAPRATGKVQVKVQAKAKVTARSEHRKHECAVERKDTRKQIANSRLQRVQTAGRFVT